MEGFHEQWLQPRHCDGPPHGLCHHCVKAEARHPLGLPLCPGGCPVVLMGKGNDCGILTSMTTRAMCGPGRCQQSHHCGPPHAIICNKSLWSPPDERCARMSPACAGAPWDGESSEETRPPCHFCYPDAALSHPSRLMQMPTPTPGIMLMMWTE